MSKEPLTHDYLDSPILITGCARSGTSLIAGIIDASGAFGGQMFGPNSFNARGMFENKYIRQEMVKPYLSAIYADPMGQSPLPIASTVPIVQDWNLVFTKRMVEEGYLDGPVFYKGAKACLMWPVWAAAFPFARWIIVRRKTKEIVDSCLRTPFMRAWDKASKWEDWVDHHKQCFREMKAANLNTFEVWPENIIKGDLSEVKDMLQWLDLDWDERRVVEMVSPELWHVVDDGKS